MNHFSWAYKNVSQFFVIGAEIGTVSVVVNDWINVFKLNWTTVHRWSSFLWWIMEFPTEMISIVTAQSEFFSQILCGHSSSFLFMRFASLLDCFRFFYLKDQQIYKHSFPPISHFSFDNQRRNTSIQITTF